MLADAALVRESRLPENAVEVRFTELDPRTLRNLAQEFVTRDGTDYGAVEKTLDERVEALLRQLETGRAKIYFESDTETINIVSTKELGS